MSGLIGALRVTLGLDSANFERGRRRVGQEADRMRQQMSRAAGAIGGAFAGMLTADVVGQFRKMTRDAVDAVGGLGEVASQLGVTTDALQEFRYVASQTGIEEAQIDKALQRLTRTLGDIERGAKGPTKALAALGLTAADLKGKDASEALLVLADAMEKLPNAQARSAAGFMLMGKQFQTLLPMFAEGRAGIQKMITDAQNAGVILTEEQIAQADQAADAITAIEKRTQARTQALLAQNADQLVEFEAKWAEFKINLINGVISFDRAYTAFQWRMFHAGEKMRADLRQLGRDFMEGWRAAADSVGLMVTAIGDWIGNKLNATFNWLQGRIETVKGWFYGLYDAVVGHSYIPDMVDGIGRHMRRLDAEMVDPAARATTTTADRFREMAGNVRQLLAQLFPEVERWKQYQEDLAALRSDSGLSGNRMLGEAESRLMRRYIEAVGSSTGNSGGFKDMSDFGAEPLTQGLEGLEDALDSLAEKSKVQTVRVADSFKDMAEKTLGAINSLATSIKGGSFLDILGSVIGLGLQLGSVGAFGKSIQNNLRSVPGYANGTNFHPGGWAMVGERGPELARLPRGTQVFPNGFGANSRVQVEIVDTTGLFVTRVNGQIMQNAPSIATAGARGGVSLMTHQRSRKLSGAR